MGQSARGAMRVSDDEALDAAGSLSLRVSHHRRTGRLTTPQWLRLASVSITCGVLIFGMVTAIAVVQRRDAADAVAVEATPLLLDAQKLYISLAQADAAESTTFLQAGNEDLDLRERYLDGVRHAAELVEKIAAEASLSPAMQQAIDTIAGELPSYSGYVETARANKRLDFPVGAASLGRAADRMRNTMFPAPTDLFDSGAVRLYYVCRT